MPSKNVIEIDDSFDALYDASLSPTVVFGRKDRVVTVLRELCAEYIGTFLVVQMGTGAVMSALFTDSDEGIFQIACVWLIALTIALTLTGSVSGGHLNPAVSFAMAVFRNFPWMKVPPFIAAQTVGAASAAALNLVLYSAQIEAYEKKNFLERSESINSARGFGEYFSTSTSIYTAFGVELFGTAVLVAVTFYVSHPKHRGYPPINGALAVGMTFGALVAVLGPLTQGGFNPARDFGPRFVAYLAGWTSVAFQNSWIYLLAPIAGAPFGAALIDFVLLSEKTED